MVTAALHPAEQIIVWRRTLDRAADCGARWQGSRFEAYLSVHDTVRMLSEAPTPDGFAAFRADRRNMLLLYEAASQMMQLEIASRAWQQLNQHVLERKLRLVMNGGDLPNTKGESDKPRDTLVELVAASIFAVAPPGPVRTIDLLLHRSATRSIFRSGSPYA